MKIRPDGWVELDKYDNVGDLPKVFDLLQQYIKDEVDRQLTQALGKRDEPAKLKIEVKVVEE